MHNSKDWFAFELSEVYDTICQQREQCLNSLSLETKEPSNPLPSPAELGQSLRHETLIHQAPVSKKEKKENEHAWTSEQLEFIRKNGT